MSMPPNTAQMSLIEKLLLLRRMAEDAGRDWEANLIEQIIADTPLVEIDNRADPNSLYDDPRRAFIYKTPLPKVSFTYRGAKFEMISAYVPTMTITGPSYPQPRKTPTESQPNAH